MSLPYNVIGTQAAAEFRGYFLTKESLLAQMSSRQTTINSYSDYWNVRERVFRALLSWRCPTFPTFRTAKITVITSISLK